MSQELIHRRRWQILGVLILSLLVVVLDTSILNVALKTLAEPKPKGLGASQTALEWATNSYTLAFAGLLLTWGILGDRLGRRWVLLGGMIAFGIFSAMCAYAQSPGELIVFRALMGIAGAAVMPTTVAIISNVFEPAERAKAIGIWAGAVGIALAIGPITGGLLLAHFWWGSVFMVNVPIVIVAVALMIWLVPNSKNPSPGKLDPLGVLLSIIAITGFVFGIIRGGDIGWLSAGAIVPILAGVAVFAAFIAWERRFSSPILDTKLFASKHFSAAVAVTGLMFCAYMGLVFVIAFYAQSARGFSPLQAGALILPLAVGQIIFAARSAGLVQRYGPRPIVSAGMVMLTVTFLYYTRATATSPIFWLEVVLFVQGAAFGLVMPPVTSSIMASVPRHKAGEGSAISNTSRQVGGALGVAILGAILASVYRSGVDPHLTAIPALTNDPSTLHSVSASITATLAFAQHIGPAGNVLIQPAVSAFVHAMHEAAVASVVISGVGAAVAIAWIPTKRQVQSVMAAHGGAPVGAPPADGAPADEVSVPVAVEA